MKGASTSGFFLLGLLTAAAPAWSQTNAIPTDVVVRAVARDAKLIGSGVGGARIVIKDVKSGEILAQGIQTGGTGDMQRIMLEPRSRGATVFDTEGAARFRATLMLEKPTLVDITAEGPLQPPHASQKAIKRVLLVPGKHILDDGVVLELHGLIVEIVPQPSITPIVAGASVPVRAKVRLLCGCPTEPGGMWDASDIEIVARLKRGRDVVS